MRGSYGLLCAALGLVLGLVPGFFHGPIPEKWSYYYYADTPIDGAFVVWGYYAARMSIGVLVGVSVWPPQWWLRGPLAGAFLMLPLGLVALANPLCGTSCMFWNTFSAALVGFLVGLVAFLVTGRDHA
jgi:hypothetical protein